MPSVGNEGSITNVSLSERRGQTDAKPRAISSLLEYCRGAKEEDEVDLFGLGRAVTEEDIVKKENEVKRR